jgi:hypothetical protein
MGSIVKGEQADGPFWISDLDIPRWASDLIVFDQLNLTYESQEHAVSIAGKMTTRMAVPRLNHGFETVGKVEDAVLSAMGYKDHPLPPSPVEPSSSLPPPSVRPYWLDQPLEDFIPIAK